MILDCPKGDLPALAERLNRTSQALYAHRQHLRRASQGLRRRPSKNKRDYENYKKPKAAKPKADGSARFARPSWFKDENIATMSTGRR